MERSGKGGTLIMRFGMTATLAFSLWLSAFPGDFTKPPSQLEKGLVAWWSFDGDRGNVARDSSGRGNHGLIQLATWVEGRIGRGLRFDKDRSLVKIPCKPALNLGSAITIEAWIYPVAPPDVSRVIIAKNDEYALRIDKESEGGNISFFPHVGSPAVAWEPRVSSKKPPSRNSWHHVAAVWDGQVERLYLDGILQAERERTGRSNPNPYPVIIGNWEYPSCHGTCFGGVLDEVKIWNRPLSAEEVQQHWQLTPPPPGTKTNGR